MEQTPRQWRGKPWEQQPDESAKAWAAFQAYLRLGEHRNMRQASKDAGRALSQLSRWSKRFLWQFRVDQWDAIRTGAAAQAALKAAEVAGEKEGQFLFQVTSLMGEAALLAAERLVNKLKSKPDMTLGVMSTNALVDIATKLKRLEMGQPTAIVSMNAVKEALDPVMSEIEKYRERRIAAWKKEAEA